jgi:hypothetical protein
MYTADALENVDCVGLTAGGLLLVVLLTGGDYHDGVSLDPVLPRDWQSAVLVTSC